MENQKNNATSKKICEFTVYGEPIQCSNTDTLDCPRIWDQSKHTRFNYKQTIKNQYNSQQIVDGPIEIIATFFMKKHHQQQPEVNHIYTPSLFKLFNFVNRTCAGVVYKKDCIISALTLKKIYDKEPRTEIKIVRLQ